MNLVQVLNPKTNRYVLMDRDGGAILAHKADEGPYPDIPIAQYRTVKEPDAKGSITVEEVKAAVSRVKGYDPAHGCYRGSGSSEESTPPMGGSGIQFKSGKAKELRGAASKARQIQEELKSQGRTFSDSGDLQHWMRRGLTPEEAAELLAEGEHGVSEEAIEFSERFNKQYRETLKRLADS